MVIGVEGVLKVTCTGDGKSGSVSVEERHPGWRRVQGAGTTPEERRRGSNKSTRKIILQDCTWGVGVGWRVVV